MRSACLAVVSSMLFGACTVVTSPKNPVVLPPAESSPSQEANVKYGPEPGDSLLQVGGALTAQTTDTGVGGSQTTTSIVMQGGIGWFQSEWLEIGGQVIANYNDSGATLISIAPYANANFVVDPRVWLYAGPHIGLAYMDQPGGDATSIAYGVHGGSRYWLTPRASLFGEMRYTLSEFEISSVDIDTDTFEILFGLAIVF